MVSREELYEIAFEGMRSYPEGPFAKKLKEPGDFKRTSLCAAWFGLAIAVDEIGAALSQLEHGMDEGDLDAVMDALDLANEYDIVTDLELVRVFHHKVARRAVEQGLGGTAPSDADPGTPVARRTDS